MQEQYRRHKAITYTFAALTGIVLLLVWFINELHQNYTSANPRIAFLQENYLTIIIVTMLVSIAAGYTLSTYAYRKLAQTSKRTEDLIDLLYVFLDREEKAVLEHLVANDGDGKQADISRLDHMTRVKAHRTLQNMQEKDLVDIKKRGKINTVHLTKRVQEILLET